MIPLHGHIIPLHAPIMPILLYCLDAREAAISLETGDRHVGTGNLAEEEDDDGGDMWLHQPHQGIIGPQQGIIGPQNHVKGPWALSP